MNDMRDSLRAASTPSAARFFATVHRAILRLQGLHQPDRPDTAAAMLKIYGALLSPFVRKVRAVLAEKQVQYALVPANPFEKSENFLKLSPLGRIPALEDEEHRHLADSSVIVEYLEERFPSPALFPKDPYHRARVRWF